VAHSTLLLAIISQPPTLLDVCDIWLI